MFVLRTKPAVVQNGLVLFFSWEMDCKSSLFINREFQIRLSRLPWNLHLFNALSLRTCRTEAELMEAILFSKTLCKFVLT